MLSGLLDQRHKDQTHEAVTNVLFLHNIADLQNQENRRQCDTSQCNRKGADALRKSELVFRRILVLVGVLFLIDLEDFVV